MFAPSSDHGAGAPLPPSPSATSAFRPPVPSRPTQGAARSAGAQRWLAPAVLLGAWAVAGGGAQAQTTAPAPADAAAIERPSPRLERIVVEDGGTRIDETRVGGVTRQIDVQPKGSTPAYQIQPTQVQGPATSASERTGQPGGAGRASWSLMRF